MKQILQNLSTGQSELIEAPAPRAREGHVLVDTTVSLISTGTERMLVEFGRAGIVSKARQQPEKVRQVLDKVAADGVMTTLDAVRSKLGQPIPLGYCNVGVVSESRADGLRPGERVVSNGPHADVVSVPKNLCAHIPDEVSDEAAAFTVVASIGLQGIRLAQPTLGEAFVVTGVGLIGLLTVQMLRAQGCRVMAIDFDPAKLALARQFGAETCNPGAGEDPVAAGLAFSRGLGVDGVIVTASSKSSDPISQGARMCRKRGRIILVGVTGLELNRSDFYEKELTFQVSCSYGPGRYEAAYEEKGQDYPLGFVRWTEQRNFVAVLDMLAAGTLDVGPLISHRIPFEKAPRAYDLLSRDKSALGIVLTYSHEVNLRHHPAVALAATRTPCAAAGKPVVGFIGAGNYASRILIPAFKSAGAHLHTISSVGGTNAVLHGRKGGFARATTDTDALIADPDINTVAIVTRHNSHARLAAQALRAGKHVFVEKPLALTHEELEEVRAAHDQSGCHLMVGFNRRFAPQISRMKQLLNTVHEPKILTMTVNAGELSPDHWHYDRSVGGGRIISEGCHFIDLLRYLVGAPIKKVHATALGEHPALRYRHDKVSMVLNFEDGSLGTILYLANGAPSYPKEVLDVFCGGRVLKLMNYRKLRAWGWPGIKRFTSMRQDKGQNACASAFLNAVATGEAAPLPIDELIEVSRITIDASAQVAD